jgi:hypothetical protein
MDATCSDVLIDNKCGKCIKACRNGSLCDKLRGVSPRANYAERATAAWRRSLCQLLLIKGAVWSAWRFPTAVFSVFLDQTPWPEFESEICRPSDCRLATMFVPTFADRGCRVVSAMGPHGRVLGISRPGLCDKWYNFNKCSNVCEDKIPNNEWLCAHNARSRYMRI